MGYYVNTTGKILAASAVVGVATGNGPAVARGCLTGLVVWMCWCCLFIGLLYYLIFG